jgi:hypothetical protein
MVKDVPHPLGKSGDDGRLRHAITYYLEQSIRNDRIRCFWVANSYSGADSLDYVEETALPSSGIFTREPRRRFFSDVRSAATPGTGS